MSEVEHHGGMQGALIVVGAWMLTACVMLPTAPEPEISTPPEVEAAPSNGAIYQAGQGLTLFEDQKARRVGDTLTVLLVETTTAKTSAATSTSKKTDSSITGPKILGQSVTYNGIEILDNSLGSAHTFDGSGDSTQSNTLAGNIGAVVVRRLANGNLVIRGEKRMQLNQGDEYVRVEGIVRPQDIAADNTIPSSRIANARIAYSGRGTLAESNAKGWLARFFSSEWMPF